MNLALVNSAEVDAIVSTVEINNLDTIVSFGAEAAEEISKASDVLKMLQVLNLQVKLSFHQC